MIGRERALEMAFFFNDTATTEIYTLSLHDALPISGLHPDGWRLPATLNGLTQDSRSEEHTSELQSPCNLVCRLLLEKKKPRTPLSSQSSASPSRYLYSKSMNSMHLVISCHGSHVDV